MTGGGDWAVPELWKVEFLNVLTTYCRTNGMKPAEAETMLFDIDQVLGLKFSRADPVDILHIATINNISAYDATFISLARSLDSPLVTADKKLLSVFPQNTIPLSNWD
jgi:predicted nucleic acid-binding protein